ATANYDSGTQLLTVTSNGVTETLKLTNPAFTNFSTKQDAFGGTQVSILDLVATLSSASAAEGTPISVVTASDSGTDVLGTATYQWMVDTGTGFVNATGTGATTATYTPTEDDEGGTLEVVVTVANDAGNPGNTESTTVVAGLVHESPTENASFTVAGL